jgi:OOP family OmpA-OmpF porin
MEKLQKDQAMKAKEQLEKELEELRAQKTERGSVLTLGDILFETDKAELLPGAMRTIDKLAEFLRNHPERNIIIEGHTDNTGSATYNLGLSQRRADGVRGVLLERGINSERIVTKGYGQEFPVATNSTSAGRQQNRRVEIIILDEGVSPEKMLR